MPARLASAVALALALPLAACGTRLPPPAGNVDTSWQDASSPHDAGTIVLGPDGGVAGDGGVNVVDGAPGTDGGRELDAATFDASGSEDATLPSPDAGGAFEDASF